MRLSGSVLLSQSLFDTFLSFQVFCRTGRSLRLRSVGLFDLPASSINLFIYACQSSPVSRRTMLFIAAFASRVVASTATVFAFKSPFSLASFRPTEKWRRGSRRAIGHEPASCSNGRASSSLPDTQIIAEGKTVGTAPSDASLAADPFEVAHHQHPKVSPRRNAWSADAVVVVFFAPLRFLQIAESELALSFFFSSQLGQLVIKGSCNEFILGRSSAVGSTIRLQADCTLSAVGCSGVLMNRRKGLATHNLEPERRQSGNCQDVAGFFNSPIPTIMPRELEAFSGELFCGALFCRVLFLC